MHFKSQRMLINIQILDFFVAMCFLYISVWLAYTAEIKKHIINILQYKVRKNPFHIVFF